jgi:pyridoxal/pyridoxine/pyridoxamine kinase
LNGSDFKNIIEGLAENNLLNHDAIFTGYTRSSEVLLEIESAIKQTKLANDKMMYFLDPVMGMSFFSNVQQPFIYSLL